MTRRGLIDSGFAREHAQALDQLRRAVAALEPKLDLQVGMGPESGDLCLLPASLVRPTLVVSFPSPFSDNRAARELALSSLAWEGSDELEPWRMLSAPLARVPRLGKADERRPWVLTHGAAGLACAGEVAAELGGQVHALGVGPVAWARHRDVVVWPLRPGVAFALLGRAVRVVAGGDYDPLLLDAWRVGVPTTGPCRLEPLLPWLVPPSLLGHAPFWAELASSLPATLGGQPAPALFTPRWVETGRRLSRAGSPTDKVGSKWRLASRRYAKLRREPDRFFADSRYRPLRAVGRWWFRD